MTRILLLGGGHTHVVALRHLARRPVPGLDVHLVSPDPTTSYSGLLPGHIAGHWPRHALEIPLSPLCHAIGATLHTAHATSLNPVSRTVGLEDGHNLAFDYASLDIGAIASLDATGTLVNVGIPVKPLGPFADRWSSFLSRAVTGATPPHVTVIGAGVAGIELALSMKYGLDRLGLSGSPKVALVERGNAILPDGTPSMRKHLRAELDRAGVSLHLGDAIENADETSIHLASGRVISARFVALATGARAHAWLVETGLALHDGFVSVGPTLQSLSHPCVFACGDAAHLSFSPRPKAGVFAVRQGILLAEQIRRLIKNRPLMEYRPQADYLKLVSLGRQHAIAEKWGIAANLPGLWTLKRIIDFNFMRHNKDKSKQQGRPVKS